MSADAELEERLKYQEWLMVNALTEDEKTTAWIEMKRLHGMRSPERVEQMERDAGLAPRVLSHGSAG
jgi:hypothetical protein